jgi:hypothetical protein
MSLLFAPVGFGRPLKQAGSRQAAGEQKIEICNRTQYFIEASTSSVIFVQYMWCVDDDDDISPFGRLGLWAPFSFRGARCIHINHLGGQH